MSIWSAVDPVVSVSTQLLARAVRAERSLILTVRTSSINDTQGVASQHCLLLKSQHTEQSQRTCTPATWHQERKHLILSPANTSKSITAPTRVKRFYFISVVSITSVFIGADCLKRSRGQGRASNGPQSQTSPMGWTSLLYEAFSKIYLTSFTGSWCHEEA